MAYSDATASSPQESQPAGQNVPEYRKYPKGFRAKKESAFIQLRVPVAIQEAEWDWCMARLRLSDPQKALLSPIYEAYRHEDWDDRQEMLQGCWDRAADLASAGVGTNDTATKLFVEVLKDADKGRDAIEAVESRFFNRVSESLSDSQLPYLQAVRNYRQRVKASAVAYPLTAALVDLESLLVDMRKDGFDVGVDTAEVDQALAEYSAAATEPMSRRARDDLRDWPKRLQLQSEVSGLLSTGDARVRERAVALDADYRQMAASLAKLARAVVEINLRLLDRVAGALPPASEVEFRERFWRRSCPVLFPDPHDLAALLKSCAKVEGLSGEQSAAVEKVIEVYLAQSNPLLKRMTTAYFDWRSERIVSSAGNMRDYPKYAQEMLEQDAFRRLCADQALDGLRGVLTPAQWNAVSPALQAWKKQRDVIESERKKPNPQGHAWPLPSS